MTALFTLILDCYSKVKLGQFWIAKCINYTNYEITHVDEGGK